jgi:hypothetical protein
VIGSCLLGLPGLIVGLVVGLLVYAPTAPVASVEIGAPSAAIGGLIGFAVAVVFAAVRRVLMATTPR